MKARANSTAPLNKTLGSSALGKSPDKKKAAPKKDSNKALEEVERLKAETEAAAEKEIEDEKEKEREIIVGQEKEDRAHEHLAGAV